jgi:hypothetical protein
MKNILRKFRSWVGRVGLRLFVWSVHGAFSDLFGEMNKVVARVKEFVVAVEELKEEAKSEE